MGEGSKRARRDSSSSLGSSLSMEMPPLFSNGVVGQTTSHLVSRYFEESESWLTEILKSRETDLSLGSLLSRNQSLFGHSHHPPHPSLPLSSMSHLSQVGMRLKISLSCLSQTLSQSVITAHAQSQTSRQPRQSGSGNSRSPGGGPDRYRPSLSNVIINY